MQTGVEIYMTQLNSVEIAEDGETMTVGGGTMSINVTDTLWAAGKQTGKSTASGAISRNRTLTLPNSHWNL